MAQDKTLIVTRYIDNLIQKDISDGRSFSDIVNTLQMKIEKFEKTLQFTNETETRFHYLTTHNKVCNKRINDLNFIQSKSSEIEFYKSLNQFKKFELIKLRDKLLG